MFLTSNELNSVIYEYQLSEITEQDNDIVELAIDSAVEEMKSYLSPSGQIRFRDGRNKYDTEAIFTAEGSDRNAIILTICKSIALYHVCALSNVDIIEEKVKNRYERAIDWLEKVAGVGKYSEGPTLSPNLPVLDETDIETKPFRFGSRVKFNHE